LRTTPDRIRHAISFELIGLSLVTPLGAWTFDKPLHDIGIVSLVSAAVAMAWNYLYNLGFDHAMLRLAGHLRKSLRVRVLHALLFETGLVAILLPFFAWYLQIGLLPALAMDAGFSVFFLVYAFVFNLAYDHMFPIPGLHRDD
jgi:uncharacterized membrane protein